VIISVYIFEKSLLIAIIMPNFWCDLTRIFLAILLVSFYRIMSAGSPQHRVRQRTVRDRAAIKVMIMDHPVIAERNVVRSDIMVAPLDSVHDTDLSLGVSSLLCLCCLLQVCQTFLCQPRGVAGR
jgi:hypothetical protein